MAAHVKNITAMSAKDAEKIKVKLNRPPPLLYALCALRGYINLF